MKVILKKDIQNLGKAGEIKTIKDGYGRNYLIPKGFVEIATPGVVRSWKLSAEKRKKRVEQENEALKKVAEKIAAITLSFSRPVAEDETIFGSVAKSDIVKSLKAADIEVHKDMVNLPASIKALGNFEVEIALKSDITANVKIVVTAHNK
ncbi:MAG: 50S ribosomal protein L9 [Elusimicrobiota bacterium]|nr:50S ribosomal protein L9 [Elusimicrobiota bacterium]